MPDLAGFPRDRWLRSLRSAWRETALDAVGYGDPRGVPELRGALADYLGRVRGAAADPEHLMVCTGYYDLARCELKLNRPKEARLHLEKALQLEPEHQAARTELALLQQRQSLSQHRH